MTVILPEQLEELFQTLYHDIPRIYTAFAQWGACMVYIFLLKRKRNPPGLGAAAILFLILQSLLLVCTEHVPTWLWLPVMAAAACSLYGMISVSCRESRTNRIYAASCAFLLSEFAASFEWVIYYHFRYVSGIESPFLEYGLVAGIYGALFAGIWFAERSLLNRGSELYVSKQEMFSAIAIVISIFLFSNLSYVFPNTPFSSQSFYDSFKLRAFINLLGLGLILIFQLNMRERSLLKESYAMNAVLRCQYDRYLNHQESMELVNLKYHDLKHQITALRMETDEKKREQWLDSMEQELDSYKNIVDSGNPVLDVLLESKLMQAKKHHIEITCVADGKLLDFMYVTDICTIFGNALDNAIEAELLEPEENKRMIHVSISSQRQFVFIKVENYISRSVPVSKGLPGTTKADKKNHGYGLKSIRRSAEKYQGNMTVKINANWFVLNVMIPGRE